MCKHCKRRIFWDGRHWRHDIDYLRLCRDWDGPVATPVT